MTLLESEEITQPFHFNHFSLRKFECTYEAE